MDVDSAEVYFHVLMARLDRLENKLQILIDKVMDEVSNGNKPKDLPLNEFFSTLCTLKGWNEQYPSAIVYERNLGLFFKFMRKKYPKMKSLRELTPTMVCEYVRHLKNKRIFSRRRDQWEGLSEHTISEHIKKLRYALEIVDSRGTQELRQRLITIKRPKTKKEVFTPTDEEPARIPEMLKVLRESRNEESRYLAFIAATVLQMCGKTHEIANLRFDMRDGLEEGEQPTVCYIGKHRVEQVKAITNEWYRGFLEEWKQHVQQGYRNTPYFFPNQNGGHLSDRDIRRKFKYFMRMCGLPQLTIHSFRYIYATKLYLKGVPQDAIKDI